jgi:glycosyltransferase involved in cell wall biosynthesis
VTADENTFAARVMGTLRALHWMEVFQQTLPYNHRTEIMALYAKSDAASCHAASSLPTWDREWLRIDFANPWQEAKPDFVPGISWPRYYLPAGSIRDANGIRSERPAAAGLVIRVRVPVKAEIGDRIQLRASGDGGEDRIEVYVIDGLLGRHYPLSTIAVQHADQARIVEVSRPWLPDQFGLALELHLFGHTQLHALHYLPIAEAKRQIPFVRLESGYQVIRWSHEGLIYSWGVGAGATPLYPQPPLTWYPEALQTASYGVVLCLLQLVEAMKTLLQQEWNDMQHVLERTEQSRQAAENAYSVLQEQYQTLQDHAQRASLQYETQNQNLEVRLEEKEQQRAFAEDAYASLQQEYQTMASTLAEVEQKSHVLRESLAEAESQRVEAERKSHMLRENLAEAESQRVEAEQKSHVLDETLTQIHIQLAEAVQTSNMLREMMERTEKRRVTAEQSYAKLQDEYQALLHLFWDRSGIRGGTKEILRTIKRRALGPSTGVPKPSFTGPWDALPTPLPLLSDSPKVLILSHMYPHPDQPSSGPFVHEQVRALRSLEHVDARVLVGRPYWMRHPNPVVMWRAEQHYRHFHEACEWVLLDGVPIKYLPYRIIGPFWTHAWAYRASLCRRIEQIYADFPFELIHAHTGYLDGSAGLAMARRFQVPLVITEHTGPFADTLMQHPIIKRLTLRSLESAERVIAVSHKQQGDVAAHMASRYRARVCVLPNGVDTERFYPSATSKPNPQTPRILYVGYFVPVKNVTLLLHAFARVLCDLPGARLTLVGAGETPQQERDLQDLADDLQIRDKLRFMGFQPREAVARIMREEADLLVLSSHAETFGCVLTESLASGKPVVSTMCGGPEDIITADFMGELCENHNPEALAKAIVKVATNIDTYSASQIRQYVEENLSYSFLAGALNSLYQSICTRS